LYDISKKEFCCIVWEKWRKDIFEMALKIGMTGEASTLVVHENTAAAVGAGGVEVCSDGERGMGSGFQGFG
jgi:hypothetical protein